MSDSYRCEYYAVLGVSPAATHVQVREAYHRRIRLVHPDLHRGGDEKIRTEAERTAAQLNEAWQVLGDPDQRERYDRARGWKASGPEGRSTDAGPPAGTDPSSQEDKSAPKAHTRNTLVWGSQLVYVSYVGVLIFLGLKAGALSTVLAFDASAWALLVAVPLWLLASSAILFGQFRLALEGPERPHGLVPFALALLYCNAAQALLDEAWHGLATGVAGLAVAVVLVEAWAWNDSIAHGGKRHDQLRGEAASAAALPLRHKIARQLGTSGPVDEHPTVTMLRNILAGPVEAVVAIWMVDLVAELTGWYGTLGVWESARALLG